MAEYHDPMFFLYLTSNLISIWQLNWIRWTFENFFLMHYLQNTSVLHLISVEANSRGVCSPCFCCCWWSLALSRQSAVHCATVYGCSGTALLGFRLSRNRSIAAACYRSQPSSCVVEKSLLPALHLSSLFSRKITTDSILEQFPFWTNFGKIYKLLF